MNKKIAVFGILVMFLLTSFFVSTGTSIKIDVKTNEKTDVEKTSFYETTDSSLPSYFSWRDIDGVEFECSQFATISNNIIKNNGECGIYLRYTSNQNHICCENQIENNNIGVKIEKSIRNIVTGNSFIDNDQQAIFVNSYFNRWNRNYWNDWTRISPRIITGSIGHLKIPWINFDWRPCPTILS